MTKAKEIKEVVLYIAETEWVSDELKVYAKDFVETKGQFRHYLPLSSWSRRPSFDIVNKDEKGNPLGGWERTPEDAVNYWKALYLRRLRSAQNDVTVYAGKVVAAEELLSRMQGSQAVLVKERQDARRSVVNFVQENEDEVIK